MTVCNMVQKLTLGLVHSTHHGIEGDLSVNTEEDRDREAL